MAQPDNTIDQTAEPRCPACQSPRPDFSRPCPHCGAPPAMDLVAGAEHRRTFADQLMQVRSSDLEPYVGLRYLSGLFKVMAIILVLLLVFEVIMGLVAAGQSAIPTLLGEASRLIVLAGLLWGAGDLAILLIDMGHDIRAARILLGRQAAHHVGEPTEEERQRVAGGGAG